MSIRPRPPDRCEVLPEEDHSQGWRLRHPKDAPLGAPLTVIFARRENARREEDGPVSSVAVAVPVGALLRELPACGCGPADLVAAPSPEGSRPSGLGMPARPGVGAVPANPDPALA